MKIEDLFEELVECSDRLPVTNGMITKPLVWVVDGKARFGYYHVNGWFYSDAGHYRELSMAIGHDNATRSAINSERPKATHWSYLKS